MHTVDTLHGAIPAQIFEALSNIRLLVCDVDGVFSDGRIYLGNSGEELKAFHTRDGFGMKAIRKAGVATAVITGRNSRIVADRMASLQVDHIIQGEENKLQALQNLIQSIGLTPEQVVAIGDDVPDIGMFNVAAVGIAVNDAHPLVKQNADWVTHNRGGFGAVREVCDILLQVNNALQDFSGSSV